MSSRRRLGARYITTRRRILNIGAVVLLVALVAWAVWAFGRMDLNIEFDALRVGLLPAAEVALFAAGALMIGPSLAPVWIRIPGGLRAWKRMVLVGAGLALLGAGLVAFTVWGDGGPWAFDSRLVQVMIVGALSAALGVLGAGRPFVGWLAGLVVAVASASIVGDPDAEYLARAAGRLVTAAWVGSLIAAVPAFTRSVFTEAPPAVVRGVDRLVLIHGWSLLLLTVASAFEAFFRTPDLAMLVSSRVAQLRAAHVVIGAIVAAWGAFRRRPEMGALIEAAVAVIERDQPRRRIRAEDELAVPVDNLLGIAASRIPQVGRIVLVETTAVALLAAVMILAA